MTVQRIIDRVTRLSGAFIVVGALVGMGAGNANAAACVNWAGIPPLNPGSSVNVLSDVAVLSACNVLAVGAEHGSGTYQTLAEHWNGLAWTTMPSPSPGGSAGDSVLSSVVAKSGMQAWAVGSYSNGTASQTLIETLRGTAWKQVSSPNPGGSGRLNFLNAVTEISAKSAWAVGYYSTGANFRTLTERWNGATWRQVPSPNPNGPYDTLLGVTATSATNAWAVGYTSPNGDLYQTLIEHWNGLKWQHVASPDPGGPSNINELVSVAASSASNAWAVGRYVHNNQYQPLIEHWNGHSWKPVLARGLGSAPGYLTSVTVLSAGNAWAVGNYHGQLTLAEHWNGTAWNRVPSPNPGSYSELDGVAGLGPSTIWTVGHYNTGGPDLALALHCC
jgi:hypothetical protein